MQGAGGKQIQVLGHAMEQGLQNPVLSDEFPHKTTRKSSEDADAQQDGPHDAIDSSRLGRKMPLFASCGIVFNTGGPTLSFNFDAMELLDQVQLFVDTHGRLPKKVGPAWWPGEYPLGSAF